MNRLEAFNEYRSLLFAIAYRMLSSVSDAEDIVQEVWMRWQGVEGEIQSPKAFLSKLATHLCVDHLRAARVRRERYVGSWLPEPLLTSQTSDFVDQAELAESLSLAFLTLLDCLSPTERAVFLLRGVFHYTYTDIAKILSKNEPNCRQIFRRARQHLDLHKQNHSSATPEQESLVEQFLEYWNQGDAEALIALMAEDVTFWGDGGGKVVAVRYPLRGRFKVAHFLTAIRRSRLLPTFTSQVLPVNGQLGIVNSADGNLHSIFSFGFTNQRISAIFAVVNPEKLRLAVDE